MFEFGETQSIRLQKLHNRAAHIIVNLPSEDQQTALDALGWEPLKEQRKKAKIMFKILNDKCLNNQLLLMM